MTVPADAMPPVVPTSGLGTFATFAALREGGGSVRGDRKPEAKKRREAGEEEVVESKVRSPEKAMNANMKVPTNSEMSLV